MAKRFRSPEFPPEPMKYRAEGIPPIPIYVRDLMEKVGVTQAELTELKLDYGPHHPMAERVSIQAAHSAWGFEATGYDTDGVRTYTMWHESHRPA